MTDLKMRRAPWREKEPVLQLLVVVWLAAAPGVLTRGNQGPQNLLCYKSCCDASFQCRFNCSWEAGGEAAGANYTVHFWYHEQTLDERHQRFAAGNSTYLLLNQDHIYALKTVTVWVESQGGDNGPPRPSKNRTLLISQAIKFKPPPAKSISFSRSKDVLNLMWPESHNCHHSPRKKEVRLRQAKGAQWSMGNCSSKEDNRATRGIAVTCRMKGNVPYEAQVRFRTSDQYSPWSDWSESIFVPAEILTTPEVNYTSEPLGVDGLRKVTLEWEKPNAEHGEVNYTLTFLLLPCQCSDEPKTCHYVSNRTSYQALFSGGEYNISLQASNKAGSPPAYSFRLPAERDAEGPSFLNVSLSGRNFTVKWEAKTEVFCFEKQPCGEPLLEQSCEEEGLQDDDVSESSGVLEPNRCYRLAVYRWNRVKELWATLGLVHLLHRNDSISVDVVNQTASSAVVQWHPPTVLTGCPGVLKKYIICCQNVQNGKTTRYEAHPSETHFSIPDLQPKTNYFVGVEASTAGREGICRGVVSFVTRPTDPKSSSLTLGFLYVAIVGGVLAAASIFHFGKKRVKEALCPALPDPANTEAVKILTTAETSQVYQKQGFMELLESSSPTEPLVIEPASAKEDSAASTTMDLPGLTKGVEEPKELFLAGSSNILASEYKGQGFLSPMEDDQQGKDGLGRAGGHPQ
ncbi:interleukin-12 receptor subunit beta-1 [Rhineura floridana]|uniref:interleukin-12 receptor subunit beta-1 n=1 Tax=Rhineura floridana TaxID=261503 RepID=UPI002AC866E1|nr:interleukin-12 receptor subunit beta-1 [Rhineura floridana]